MRTLIEIFVHLDDDDNRDQKAVVKRELKRKHLFSENCEAEGKKKKKKKSENVAEITSWKNYNAAFEMNGRTNDAGGTPVKNKVFYNEEKKIKDTRCGR